MLDYMYLWICVLLFIPWFLIYFYRPSLRNRMVKSGLLVLPFSFIDDVWFRVDYWNAPEIFSIYPVAIEDILFSFVITGVTATIYDAIFTKKQIQFYKKRVKMSLLFFPITMGLFFLLNNIFGLNSMYMWAIPMFIFAFIIIILRKDLIKPSLFTALSMSIIIIPIYMILFNYFAPDFWDKYWFLADTKHGITILGNVALLEVLYYFSYGTVAGIIYDFAKGTKKVHNNLGKKLFD